jgi:gluconolactonase
MIFVSGLNEPEGPVLLPGGDWLVVEMGSDSGCVTHISPDGRTKRVIAKTGRPNGLAVDKDGVIWVAESQMRALLRMKMDGAVDVFLTECNSEPFLFPNDLAFGPDGALYMTDSGITLEERAQEDHSDLDVHPDGRVYRIDVKTKEIKRLDSGIAFANGIAFGPDNNLYVSETLSGRVYRYLWEDGEIIGSREEFGNVLDPEGPEVSEGHKGPDGMKFGTNGHLYVAVMGQGDVTVLGRDGAVIERIKTEGRKPTNLTFGPPGSKSIYVTEVEFGTMEVFEVGTNGLPLYAGERTKVNRTSD